MIQPVEMRTDLPILLHDGEWSTTAEVWQVLVAAQAGDLDTIERLITDRPALATCQYNYTPPLHFAVREGHLELVRMLVERGAFDPEYRSYPFGDALLTIARDRGHSEVLRVLEAALERPGATRRWKDVGTIDLRQDDDERRFDQALHGGDVAEVERLLAIRPELARNPLSSWAEGVLMMPAKDGTVHLLKLLLQHGATVPPISKWGRFYYFERDDSAAFLLARGMDAGHRSWHEVTLLHDMAQAGDLVKARLLLDQGADLHAIDDEYQSTPLGMAARWGHRALVLLLLERGADPNRSGAPWSAPLSWARSRGHTAIADVLASAGAVEG
jgi:hypothetical protein